MVLVGLLLATFAMHAYAAYVGWSARETLVAVFDPSGSGQRRDATTSNARRRDATAQRCRPDTGTDAHARANPDATPDVGR